MAQSASALANCVKVSLDTAQPERCKVTNANTGTAAPPLGVATASSEPNGFTGVSPLRIIDTRSASSGGENGRVGAGRVVELDIDDKVSPATAAVAVSVTAVDPCSDGFLTVYDCDVRPNTSNVNFAAGRTTAGMAITMLTDRRLCVFSSARTDLIVDITGEFTPSGDSFFPMTPTRWVDTRGNPAVLSLPTGVRAAGTHTEVVLAGSGGIPADATAVWLNLTGVNATGMTFLTAYPGPCGTAPLASNVNIFAGRSAASAVLVGLGPTGSICIRVGGAGAHLVVDVAGWFEASTDGLQYVAGPLTRLYDSRPGSTPPAGTVHEVSIASVAVLNAVSILATANGFLSLKPCGATDTSSLINNVAGEITANATVVTPGTGGKACAFTSMGSHVLVDQLGTFVPQGA